MIWIIIFIITAFVVFKTKKRSSNNPSKHEALHLFLLQKEKSKLFNHSKQISNSSVINSSNTTDTFSKKTVMFNGGIDNNTKTNDIVKLPCPVEFIEVTKSGEKGKKAFMNAAGNTCSTEEAVRDHFLELGYTVVRGEVQFWQAMFGLAFWEEIFHDMDPSKSLNDIPLDLFSGEQFYMARKLQIDKKMVFLNTANIYDFISSRLTKYGNIWTRIIFDCGGKKEFTYRKILESEEVSAFLKVISPAVFSKIVYRIATNPVKNRAGTPDFCVWKGTDVSFIEAKMGREKIRESQMRWLAWMYNEEIVVKIIRVKGIRQPT